jgi:transcriptional regulator with XRE-family HTH domain
MNEPHWVDVHVGSRVRLRRQLLSVSQTELADAIGITFQQVQKYERGVNRVSASRLFLIARELKTPVCFFFEGLPGEAKQRGGDESVVEFITSSDGVELAKAWSKLGRPTVRRELLQLIRSLGTENA